MADEIDNNLLISLVRERPVLWDKTMDLYKSRVATQAAWKEIMIILNPDIETSDEKTRQGYVKLIIQRWTHLRDNYGRSCRKIQDQKRSGIKPAKPYIYSKKCSFLQSVLQHKETITNVTTENSNTESENNFQTNEESEINSIKNDVTKNVTSRILKRPTNTDINPIEAKMIKFMDSFSQEPKVTNRHLSFFNGILPTLDNFDDNEAIEFQMGVLQLLKRIKSSRQNHQLLNYGHQEPSSRGYFAQEYDDPATDTSKTNIIKVQASLQSPQSVDSSYSNYSVKVEDL